MTRISQLPPATAVVTPNDLIEGERVNGVSEKWTVNQAFAGATPMACRAYLARDISGWPNATILAVSWDQEEFDAHGMKAAGTQSRLTVPAGGGGLWLLIGSICYAPNSAGNRAVWFQINGQIKDRLGQVDIGASPTGDVIVRASALARLNAGDYVEVIAYQSSGTTVTIGGAYGINGPRSAGSDFSVVRLGA